MSFTTFHKSASGSKGIGDGVSLTTVQINFGKNKPPYEYLMIEYDKEKPAIRFSKSSIDDGYKVKFNKGAYYIAASSFLKKDYIPKGRYSRTADLTYEKQV